MIEKRCFGRTGHLSTAMIFGGAALIRATQKDADRVLEILLKYGVNHIDTAPRYGDFGNPYRHLDGQAPEGLLPGHQDREKDLPGGP